MSIKNHLNFPVATPALFLGGLLWVMSFWLPVFITAEGPIFGYWVFLTGWLGFVLFQFAWYANLLMLVAVIMMYSAPIRATLLAASGLLLATQAIWFELLPATVSAEKIIAQGVGFWCWYASMFLLGLGVIFGSDELTPEQRTVKVARATGASGAGVASPQADQHNMVVALHMTGESPAPVDAIFPEAEPKATGTVAHQPVLAKS